ncbi:PEP-CTERM sorting domain-containing protein [Aeoliella sp.]|uniref:PEP-CTERM sorting domain-containing protein n=1 Tax=Aeoliella sp. TaxID=2795800 RepID=UPI003CCBCF29
MVPANRVFIVILVLAFTNQSSASCVHGGAYFVPDLTNVVATNGADQLLVDTYLFDVTNSNTNPATAVELEFSGNFWAVTPFNATFRDSPGLPTFFGQYVADSFFVADGFELVGYSEDNATTLAAAWTYPGDVPVIAPGETKTLAYLTVPSGEFPTYVGGRMAVEGSFIDLLFGASSLSLFGTYIGPGASLSDGLQGAFAERNGGPIFLADAIELGVDCGHLGDLGEITTMLQFVPGEGDTVATGSITDHDGDGKYDITIDADWASLSPGYRMSGEALFFSEFGDPSVVGFGFSIRVPEPSTIALSSLALVGLVGLARRRK